MIYSFPVTEHKLASMYKEEEKLIKPICQALNIIPPLSSIYPPVLHCAQPPTLRRRTTQSAGRASRD